MWQPLMNVVVAINYTRVVDVFVVMCTFVIIVMLFSVVAGGGMCQIKRVYLITKE